MATKVEIVRRGEGLFAVADRLEVRLARARGQVDKLTPFLLARAWTHLQPARSGCALSLREILCTHSQRVQIAGQLVPLRPHRRTGRTIVEPNLEFTQTRLTQRKTYALGGH
ncbi:MAG TPA: hypothetical protein VL793_15940 [Patescibacteria group bacterium]|nr:hypothetical protein [Patescibacteria group bacterium]